eukprot:9454226-Pyramimonas_sp.AAC.1
MAVGLTLSTAGRAPPACNQPLLVLFSAEATSHQSRRIVASHVRKGPELLSPHTVGCRGARTARRCAPR